MTEQYIIMLLVSVMLAIMSVMYLMQRSEIKYLRKELIRRETAADAELTDLKNRLLAKSIGEYERLKSGPMPRDEPQPLTAHEKAIKKWHNAGKQGGIAN